MKRIMTLLACATALSTFAMAENPLLNSRARHKVFKNQETWPERHEAVKMEAAKGEAELIFVGDSITHYWQMRGEAIWNDEYARYKAINMGFSGDSVQHVLWRLQHDALEGLSPKVAVLMIGTNNSRDYEPEQVAEGIEVLCELLHKELPETKVLLLGIFPRDTANGERHLKNMEVNRTISTLGQHDWVEYLDIGSAFVDAQGNTKRALFPDLLHPNTEGYQAWADAMQPTLSRIMND